MSKWIWAPGRDAIIASVPRQSATVAKELRKMSRTRFGIVFVLLVLILLIVSTIFGVLTYWLEAESLPRHFPTPGSTEEGDDLSSGSYRRGTLDPSFL
jgi:hypothetical protein